MQHQPKWSRQAPMNGTARDAVDVPGNAPRYVVVASTDIGAPPDVVWNLYCDPHRYPEIAHATDDGTARSHLKIGIEPTPTGCRVTQRFGVEPRGAMKVGTAVMWPLFLRRLAQRAMDITVANVKAAAEAPRA